MEDDTSIRVQSSQSAVYQSQGIHKALSPWQDFEARDVGLFEKDFFDEQYYENMDALRIYGW